MFSQIRGLHDDTAMSSVLQPMRHRLAYLNYSCLPRAP